MWLGLLYLGKHTSRAEKFRYAVYVETPREAPGQIDAKDARALQRNIALAESLGATVVRVKAEKPADGLIAFAQREGDHARRLRAERARDGRS